MASSDNNVSVVNELLQKFTLMDILKMYGKYVEGVHHFGRLIPNPWNLGEGTPSFEISRHDDGNEVWSCWGNVPEEVSARLARLRKSRGLGASQKQYNVFGGGKLDLVCLLGGFDSYGEAVNHLLSESGQKFISRSSSDAAMAAGDQKMRSSSIVIEESRPEIRRSSLISYGRSRGISQALLSRYCEQVLMHFSKTPDIHHYFLSFINNKGGRALRNGERVVNKVSTSPSAPTSISSDGRFSKDVTADRVLVFEGFFNFLSYMEYFGKDIPVNYDVCVLNSVTNLSQAMPLLMRYPTIGLALDNDTPGYRAAEAIREAAEAKGIRTRDIAGTVYPSFNDMNDLLVSKSVSRCQSERHTGRRI